MTVPANLVTCDACPARRSTSLPFDMADMIAVRLLPAQFARVVGVSKQSVSKWVHAGKVTLGPDGRLDPAKAIQEVLKNTAPTRLRARIFRQAMEGADAMRVEIRALQRKCMHLEQLLDESNAARSAAVAEVNQRHLAIGAAVARAHEATAEEVRNALSVFRRRVVIEFDELAHERARGLGSLQFALEILEARVPALIKFESLSRPIHPPAT